MKLKKILEKELARIKPNEKEIKEIEEKTEKLCLEMESKIKKKKIKASVFIGGSLAKKTIMKKSKYDVDIFVRFDSQYKDAEISSLLEKITKGKKVHGSRDYFQIERGKIVFEIIPVIKILRAKYARNVTDLSFFHVSYVLGKLKKKPKLAEEILLAKSFCYGQNCYGAESYISGFSGYALELLVIYYSGFLNFLKAVSKSEKLVLDPEKFYKNKQEIMNSINEAKLSSPIIFIDPTNKERNALAALSDETFSKFQLAAKNFLKNPSLKFFEIKDIKSENYNLILKARTDRQEGDIAGSKLKKFFSFFSRELEKYFSVSGKNFEYSGKQARLYFRIKPRKQLVLQGPPVDKAENLFNFKQKHKKTFIKNNKIYAYEKTMSLKEFLDNFNLKNKRIIKSMGINEFKLC